MDQNNRTRSNSLTGVHSRAGSNQNSPRLIPPETQNHTIEYINNNDSDTSSNSSGSTIDRENNNIILNSPSNESFDNNTHIHNNNNSTDNIDNNINIKNQNIIENNFNNEEDTIMTPSSVLSNNGGNESGDSVKRDNDESDISDSASDTEQDKDFNNNGGIKKQDSKKEMVDFSVEKSKVEAAKIAKRELDARRKKLTFFRHAYEVLGDYGQCLLVSLVGAILCIFAAAAYAHPQWIHKGAGTVDYFSSESYTILVSTFFVSGLAVFTLIQFLSVYGIKRMVETHFYAWVLGVMALFMIVPWAFELGGHAWWFWLGDVLLLVIGYASLCFVMGYVGKPYQTAKERRWNGTRFLLTEVMVSATALIYGMFLIQIYGNFSNIARVAWRLLVHPVYFELFMMIPVRMLVTNQMEKGGVSIMSSLAVVHAQAHISTLGKVMLSTINQTELTIISVLLLNIGKLVFRSTVQLRDDTANKIAYRLFGTTVTHKESKGFVRAVNIYTEMIMENASIPASAYALWAFYKVRGMFFFPFPDGGEFTLSDATINVVIQLGFGLFFDAITLFINERYFNYPLERAWKKMREQWLPFFGFLLYGLTTMGMIGIIYMTCRLPRFVTCDSYDVCSCKFIDNCQEFIQENLTH